MSTPVTWMLVAVATACTQQIEPSLMASQLVSNQFSHGASLVQRVVSPSYTPQLIDQFAAASTWALGHVPDHAQLGEVVTRFDPLWDSVGRVMPAAVPRYTQRIATLPRSAVRQWASLSALDQLSAAFSLAALEGLWFDEKLSEPAYNRLVARAKEAP